MTTKAELTALNKKSRGNRSSLEKATICGCFHCFKEFPFGRIAEWIDDDQTALCPYCGVDAVLGFAFPTADQELLHEMHDRWFKPSIPLTPDEWKYAVEGDIWPPARVRPIPRKPG
jgi:hypothetical protein